MQNERESNKSKIDSIMNRKRENKMKQKEMREKFKQKIKEEEYLS